MFKDLTYGKQGLAPLLFKAIDENSLTTEYFSGVWHDIGTPERLESLNKQITVNA